MIISLEKITKYYNGETVLDDVGLTIEDNDRIGLIGVNGCGKSTLLRIITGFENPENRSAPNEPKIFKNKSVTIGYLAQNRQADGGNIQRKSDVNNQNGENHTVYDEMKSVFKPLDDAAERLRVIESEMSSIEDHQSNKYRESAEEYSRLTAFFETNDGYLTDVKISKVLNGMGFPPDTYGRIISTLSGGEKTRLAIAKLLLENPGLLILDEPTNHLDFNTVIWLEDYLKEYKGALLIVSHDRYFLDKLCTSICEIERGKLRRFKGNYSAFTKEKQALVERQMKEYQAQRQEIAKLEDYVARNLVRASTSNMAKSRLKKLDAMEIVEKPVLYEKAAKIKFEYDITPPLDILSVKALEVSVGGEDFASGGAPAKTLIESLSFNVRRGDKIGIVGANGIGKSTVLKLIQRLLPNRKGSVEWADNVKISYFDQGSARLNLNDTVIDAVHKKFRSMKEVEVRTLLGSVLLSGEDVFKKVGVISGGERAKLCFALMRLERGNVLILDEPTNHLDISTREVIERALFDYDGTVIFVSHDRYLLNKLSTRILEITENNPQVYDGGFDEYMEVKRKESLTAPANLEVETPENLSEKSAANSNYRSKEKRAADAKKRLRTKTLETEIEQLESEISRLEAELTLPEICADYILAEEKCGELERARERLNEITDEWLNLETE
ncbi:MAG: ABC-F family ATP-binding cassette domain-containing protein [Oscillospiraceae bacterium]|nr:ABC-F family ATP-binding cassette domain-containing protein [Oscillospiraceae bacterium]